MKPIVLRFALHAFDVEPVLTLHNIGLIFTIRNRKLGQPYRYGIMLRNISISIGKILIISRQMLCHEYN